MSYVWIDRDVVLAVHAQQIAEHGGAGGIRDLGLIESALAKPVNLLRYGDPDIYDLAAAYGCGIARNHGFVDGNKRTAYVVTRLFLRLNGHDFDASPFERVLVFERVGIGEMTAEELADWLKSHGIRA